MKLAPPEQLEIDSADDALSFFPRIQVQPADPSASVSSLQPKATLTTRSLLSLLVTFSRGIYLYWIFLI